jgi:hypothetical protein
VLKGLLRGGSKGREMKGKGEGRRGEGEMKDGVAFVFIG